MNKKLKILVLLISVILLLFFSGCQSQEKLQIIKTSPNVDDLKQIDPTLKEIKIDFNRELAQVKLTLTRNGEKIDNSQFETKITESQLVINNLNLKPTSIYHASILAVDEKGKQSLNTVKLITKRTAYPQIKEPNETMMQAFYWYMGVDKDKVVDDWEYKPAVDYDNKYPAENDLWNLLTERAEGLAEMGITSLWLPPAHKCHELRDEGYGVYDIWDLGEFNQNETVRTKYGTREELEKLIEELHEEGLEAYYDIVMNHRIGGKKEVVPLKKGGEGPAFTDFTNLKGRQKYYSRAEEFQWDWYTFDGPPVEGTPSNLFKGKSWDDSYDKDFLLGLDIDYQNPDVQHELKEWGEWIINEVGFDGYRIDAIKHVHTPYVEDWLTEVQKNTEKDIFYVGEAWMEDTSKLIDYLEAVNYKDLNCFDFPLRFKLYKMSRAEGKFDLQKLSSVGLVNTKYKDKAVTFVDNHDVQRDNSGPGLTDYEVQAYAYILMREQGLPTVFYKDFYHKDLKEELTTLIKARKYFAYGKGYEVNNNGEDVYSYVRIGRDDVPGTGLVMMISDGTSGKTVTKIINSRQPNTTFYDYTGNIEGVVTTDDQGRGEFKVKASEEKGWSVWVPIQQENKTN